MLCATWKKHPVRCCLLSLVLDTMSYMVGNLSIINSINTYCKIGFPGGSVVKNLPANAGDTG